MTPQRPIRNVNQLWSDIVAEELARSGVRHAVISPGSRSTPLVLALAAHPDITDHSVIDERSAGFFALGLARATGRPTVLLCTSGTASSNYYPAVCEADSAGVPLLLLTADRPVQLRDTGAPQTMDQVKLYGGHVRRFFESAQPEAAEDKLRALRATVCHAVAMTHGALPGPVHFNFPFRKPLEPMPPAHSADAVDESLLASGSPGIAGRADGRAWTRFFTSAPGEYSAGPVDLGIAQAADALLRARRPVIIAGPDAEGASYADVLLTFAVRRGIPVIAEAASQLRFRTSQTKSARATDVRDADADPPLLTTVDLLLRSEQFRAAFRPDCIIRTGGADTNAALQRFMEDLEDIDVIQLAPDLRRRDPAHAVSIHVAGDVSASLAAMTMMMETAVMGMEDGWKDGLLRADAAARAALPDALAEAGAGLEAGYVHVLGALMPAGSALFVSSSMPIRDVETFLPAAVTSFDVVFNRGVNGIDGIVSTALGTARGRGMRTVLLTGDIAFLHNLNAVYGEGLRELPLTIVLFNNNGGEIFELLPVRDFDPAFTRHFLTPQNADMRALAAGLGLAYSAAESPEAFAGDFRASLSHDSVSVIEIRTDIRRSGELRRAVLKRVAGAVDRAIGGSAGGDAASAPMVTPASAAGASGRVFPLAWRMRTRGAGTTAVFLHGFTRSGTSWDRLLDGIDGRRLCTVDLMGHGASPIPDAQLHEAAYDLAYAADRLEELFARLGLARVHLAGYSMGGRAAAVYASRYPHRLASLALISANPGIEDDAERSARRDRDDALAARILEQGLESFVREWSAQPMFAPQRTQDPAAWRAAMHDRVGQRAAGLASSLRGSGQGRQAPTWDALAELEIPVLLAAGGQDGNYSDIAARLNERLRTGILHIFEDAGHDLLIDRGTELRTALEELWQQG